MDRPGVRELCASDPALGYELTTRFMNVVVVCGHGVLRRQRRRPASGAGAASAGLPGASFLEKDDTFVNFDRRFQRVRPALAPPGQARTDFEILHGVAAALGSDLGCRTPAQALDECARITPAFAAISHERIEREGYLHWPCTSEGPGESRLYQEKFATPNGRAQLAARPWLPPGEHPDQDFPYVLVTGRRLTHYNAGTMTRRTPNLVLQPHETLDVNPDDAARMTLLAASRWRSPAAGAPLSQRSPRYGSARSDGCHHR